MSKTIRTFIAIKLTKPIEDGLRSVVQQLMKQGASGVRWVKPGNIHLTIKFLGDIVVDQVDDIGAVMKYAARKATPFKLKIGGIGAFPNLHKPRVIWVGVNEYQNLRDLHQEIELGLDRLGIRGDGEGRRENREVIGVLNVGFLNGFLTEGADGHGHVLEALGTLGCGDNHLFQCEGLRIGMCR